MVCRAGDKTEVFIGFEGAEGRSENLQLVYLLPWSECLWAPAGVGGWDKAMGVI